jgi:hypothetical protein
VLCGDSNVSDGSGGGGGGSSSGTSGTSGVSGFGVDLPFLILYRRFWLWDSDRRRWCSNRRCIGGNLNSSCRSDNNRLFTDLLLLVRIVFVFNLLKLSRQGGFAPFLLLLGFVRLVYRGGIFLVDSGGGSGAGRG